MENNDYDTIKNGNIAIFMMFDMMCDIINVNAKDKNFAQYLTEQRRFLSIEDKAKLIETMFEMNIFAIIEDVADINKKMDIFTRPAFIKKLSEENMSKYHLVEKSTYDIAYGKKR